MVRVAGLKNAVEEGDTTPDLAGLRPRQQLHVVSERAHEMVDALGPDAAWTRSCPRLAEQGVRIVAPGRAGGAAARATSRATSAPRCCPRSRRWPSTSSRPFPHAREPEPEPRRAAGARRGRGRSRGWRVVQVPSGLRRLVRPVGGEGTTYVLLEEIIRAELAALFPGQTILESAAVPHRARRGDGARRRGRPRLPRGHRGGAAQAAAAASVVRLEVEAGVGRRPARASWSSGWSVDVPDVYRVRGPARRARAACRWWSCPPSSTCASRRSSRCPRWSADEPAGHLRPCCASGDVLLHHPYESFDPVVRASSPPPPATPTCWPSSRRSTAPAATRPIVQALAARRGERQAGDGAGGADGALRRAVATSAGRAAWRRRART